MSAGGTRYSHDSLGRRIWEGPSADASRTAFTWSGERLITQSGSTWSANHVYDATGQRTRSVVTSGSLQTTTTWAYEGIRLTGLDAVRSDTATWSLEYLYDERGTLTGGIYSAEDTSCAFLVVATDRGDVRELLDANGAAFAFYSYDAYGNPNETLSRGTALVPAGLAANISQRNVLRYAGYCYDEASGLYYLSQRYYDPASASFVSKDPARADGEESAYQYCAGDPVGKVDPSGEHPLFPNTKVKGSGSGMYFSWGYVKASLNIWWGPGCGACHSSLYEKVRDGVTALWSVSAGRAFTKSRVKVKFTLKRNKKGYRTIAVKTVKGAGHMSVKKPWNGGMPKDSDYAPTGGRIEWITGGKVRKTVAFRVQ